MEDNFQKQLTIASLLKFMHTRDLSLFSYAPLFVLLVQAILLKAKCLLHSTDLSLGQTLGTASSYTTSNHPSSV